MNAHTRPTRRALATLAVCLSVIAGALSACSDESAKQREAVGPQANPEPAVTSPEEVTDEETTDVEEPSEEPAVDDTPKVAEPQIIEFEETEPEHIPGTVNLIWTGGVEYQYFEYIADHCYVGPDYIMVEGKGGPVGGSGESTVKILTNPTELLHDGTDTWAAAGYVTFTWGGNEITADGRLMMQYDPPAKSTFVYRYTANTADFRVGWYIGTTEAGGGAVEIVCNY